MCLCWNESWEDARTLRQRPWHWASCPRLVVTLSAMSTTWYANLKARHVMSVDLSARSMVTLSRCLREKSVQTSDRQSIFLFYFPHFTEQLLYTQLYHFYYWRFFISSLNKCSSFFTLLKIMSDHHKSLWKNGHTPCSLVVDNVNLRDFCPRV